MSLVFGIDHLHVNKIGMFEISVNRNTQINEHRGTMFNVFMKA